MTCSHSPPRSTWTWSPPRVSSRLLTADQGHRWKIEFISTGKASRRYPLSLPRIMGGAIRYLGNSGISPSVKTSPLAPWALIEPACVCTVANPSLYPVFKRSVFVDSPLSVMQAVQSTFSSYPNSKRSKSTHPSSLVGTNGGIATTFLASYHAPDAPFSISLSKTFISQTTSSCSVSHSHPRSDHSVSSLVRDHKISVMSCASWTSHALRRVRVGTSRLDSDRSQTLVRLYRNYARSRWRAR